MDVRVVLALGASLVILLNGGLFYVFGLYSDRLKNDLDLSQHEINTIGAIMYTGSGLASYWVSRLYFATGPRTSISLLSSLCTISLFLIYGTLRGSVPTSYVLLMVLFFTFGASCGGFFFCCVFTNQHNLTLGLDPAGSKKQHLDSIISATLTALFGLSSMVFTLVYFYLFIDSPLESFFLFMASAMAVGTVLGGLFLIKASDNKGETASSVVVATHSPPVSAKPAGRSFFVLLAVFFKSPFFWSVFLFMFFGTALGGTYMTNLSMLVESLGGSSSTTSRLMIVFSAFQVFGRLLVSGFVSTRFGARGPHLPVGLAFMMVGYMVTFFVASRIMTLGMLDYITASVAVCYGVVWTVFMPLVQYLPVIPGDGREISLAVACVMAAPAFSGLIISSVAATLYSQHETGDSHSCFGSSCYQSTFVFFSILSFVAVLCALGLLFGSPKKTSQQDGVVDQESSLLLAH